MSTHYPSLNASSTAACDHCGGPARPTQRDRCQAFRQADGWVFLCAACTPECHDTYRATRIRPATGGSCRTLDQTELSIRFPADRPPIDRSRRR